MHTPTSGTPTPKHDQYLTHNNTANTVDIEGVFTTLTSLYYKDESITMRGSIWIN